MLASGFVVALRGGEPLQVETFMCAKKSGTVAILSIQAGLRHCGFALAQVAC